MNLWNQNVAIHGYKYILYIYTCCTTFNVKNLPILCDGMVKLLKNTYFGPLWLYIDKWKKNL